MVRSLLLISKNNIDKDFCEKVAQKCELTLIVESDYSKAIEHIQSGNSEFIFLEIESNERYLAFEDLVQKTVGLFSDRIDSNNLFFISPEDISKIPAAIESPIFGHYLVRNEQFLEGGEYYAQIMKGLTQEKAFGLKNFFKSETKIQVIKVKKSTDKHKAAEAVKNYLISAKFKTRMATIVANAVDELLMNAIFDAPVDEAGRQIYQLVSRTEEITLEGQSEVEMQVGFDGTYAGITVSDQYGSLDKARLLYHISKKYSDENYQVKNSSAGAGIGLANVFRSGGSLLFVTEASARTEVTVFFKRFESYRDFKNQFRFISTQFYF